MGEASHDQRHSLNLLVYARADLFHCTENAFASVQIFGKVTRTIQHTSVVSESPPSSQQVREIKKTAKLNQPSNESNGVESRDSLPALLIGVRE